jgi:multidrug efflux pump
VLFIPYLGDRMLPEPKPHPSAADGAHGHDPYQRPFYRRFRSLVDGCLERRWLVIGATVGLFVLSLLMFRFVPQQFFPDSTRPELMVDMELAEGASLRATADEAHRLEKMLQGHAGIDNYVAYVGTGSPRFYLPLDQQLPAANFAQFVVRADDIDAREAVRDWLIAEVTPKFPELQLRVTRLENGPPVGYPVQFRISGDDEAQLRNLAERSWPRHAPIPTPPTSTWIGASASRC